MKTRRVLTTTVAVAAGVTMIAGPAMAYDRDSYSHAAGHMIERSDVPKALGAFKPSLAFNGYSNPGALYVCDVPRTNDSDPDVVVKMPGGKFVFSGSYQGRGKTDAPSIQATVNQYTDANAAIAAFDALKKDIKKCTGTGSNTYTAEDGTSSTYSVEVTNGVVPAVTTTGVESLFVSNNSLEAETPGDTKYVNDQYTVYSLVDNVVIQTTYFSNTNTNMTTKQRKAVNTVAFNAETRWLG